MELRYNPRTLLVHFDNLKRNPEVEIRCIREFLARYKSVGPGDNDLIRETVEETCFNYMRNRPDMVSDGANFLKNDTKAIFRKGTKFNNQWKGVLSEEPVKIYEIMAKQEIGKECAYWLATEELVEQISTTACVVLVKINTRR